jgi:hypothetical protein
VSRYTRINQLAMSSHFKSPLSAHLGSGAEARGSSATDADAATCLLAASLLKQTGGRATLAAVHRRYAAPPSPLPLGEELRGRQRLTTSFEPAVRPAPSSARSPLQSAHAGRALPGQHPTPRAARAHLPAPPPAASLADELASMALDARPAAAGESCAAAVLPAAVRRACAMPDYLGASSTPVVAT